jgi:FolB domain-containing protein
MWTRPLRRFFNPPTRTQYTSARSIRALYQYRGYSKARFSDTTMPLLHKFANDQIFIDSLRLKCTCGPDAFGRLKPQPVLLSMRLGTLIARAAASDCVELSVDYSALSKQLSNLENKTFKSAAEMVDEAAELALQHDGVGKVSVDISLEKAFLRAKKAKLERVVWNEDGRKLGSWKYSIEGVEVPVIIGIEENRHERTQKQMVNIDLTWQTTESRLNSLLVMSNLLDPLIAVLSPKEDLMFRRWLKPLTSRLNRLPLSLLKMHSMLLLRILQ